MFSWQSIGLLVGGLGLFLFAMFIFEEGISSLVNNNFKRFFEKATNSKLKSILTGIFTTTVLQSSSVVSLLVLAFVGVGILELNQAIAVIIGTNIWAPVTDVILGAIGLKFDILAIVMPILGIGGLGFLFVNRWPKIRHISKILVGFGLLFLGLSYMKESMGFVAQTFDFAMYSHLPVILFFFFGLILTIIMQSSSAMVVLVLTAASQGVVNLPMGMTLIMWAFLGTTLTVVLGAIWDNPIKKQVALSHVLFNLFCVVLGWIFFVPLHYVFNILLLKTDLVLTLSVFALTFRIGGAVLIYPFIPYFKLLLKKLVKEKKYPLGLEVEKMEADVPELGIWAMNKDCIKLLKNTLTYMMNVFGIDKKVVLAPLHKHVEPIDIDQTSLYNEYMILKSIEEKLISFGLILKKNSSNVDEITKINNFYTVVSSAISASKYVKDISLNIVSLQESRHSFFQKQYVDLRQKLTKLYIVLSQLIEGRHTQEIFKEIVTLIDDIKLDDKEFLWSLTKELYTEKVDKFELAGLINVHRYVYLSSLSLVESVKTLLLTPEENLVLE